MTPTLILLNLDNRTLQSSALDPPAGRIVERAEVALRAFRSHSLPVVHLGMSTCQEAGEHVQRSDRGTIRPGPGERVFSIGGRDGSLDSLDSGAVVLCGIALHDSVRETALAARRRGLATWIVDDAVASDDPLHDAISRRYLEGLGVRFISSGRLSTLLDGGDLGAPVGAEGVELLPSSVVEGRPAHDGREAMVHRSPRRPDSASWSIPIADGREVARATASARRSWPSWSRTDRLSRATLLRQWADRIEGRADRWAVALAEEIGKPLAQGRAEVVRSAAMLRAVAARASDPLEHRVGERSSYRGRSIGVIALISPWNHPLYIPLGKIAPALLYGNAVAWKPAPAGTPMSLRALEELLAAGCPPGLVNLVCGDGATAAALMSDARVDGITLTGSSAAGSCAQEIGARRRIPLQAELGGNNAAIVWSDADLEQSARQVAEGAFGMAGQRCTANRRVIVESRCRDEFLSLLSQSVAELAWGDPMEPGTQVGPLISEDQRDRVAALVARSADAGMTTRVPHLGTPERVDRLDERTYYPPTVVCCDDPEAEVAQEETFGPVLVLQAADDQGRALALCNGVRQGLVASLFSNSEEFQERFLFEAEAGILKLNRATADAEVDLPFCGWKASGIGPAEHGECDREFYTRTQTIYR
jgi:acyl-CoA reductase-like NAD-dependent aldehyde dehydrogenase/nicotinamidase-related amidase